MASENKAAATNNVIAALLIVGIVISVSGMFIGAGKILITGAMTVPGSGNATITQSTSCSLSQDITNFGSVGVSGTFSTENGTEQGNFQAIEVQNDGNTPLNVTIYAHNTYGDLFDVATPTNNGKCPEGSNFKHACGPTGEMTNCSWVTMYKFKYNSSFWDNMTYTNYTNNSAKMIAYNLSWLDANDTVESELYIDVPAAETAGSKGAVLIVECTLSTWT